MTIFPDKIAVPWAGAEARLMLVTSPLTALLKSICVAVLNATFIVNPLLTGGGALATIIVKVMLPVPIEFVAFTVTLDVPAAVAVPEIKPVAVLSNKPGGRPTALKLVGKLLAII